LNFCAGYDSVAKAVTLEISNLCVSSSYKYRGHTLSAEVDENYATIRVAGTFRYKSPAGNVGTTDCAGRRSHTLNFPGVKPWRYTIVHDGRRVGIADLGQDADRVCLRRARPTRVPVPLGLGGCGRRKGAAPGAPAARLMDLLAPYLGDYPEGADGAPETKLSITPGVGDTMQIELEMTGYLDDSVAGEKFFGHARAGPDGWVLTRLWRWRLCARGENAGLWIAGNCP